MSDSVLQNHVRSTVADVLQVAIDRVAVEYNSVEGSMPGGRRLLQTANGTQAFVWVYPDSRTASINVEFNNFSVTELQDMHTGSNGWANAIETRLA